MSDVKNLHLDCIEELFQYFIVVLYYDKTL